jgi:hypothetical protein
MSFSIVFVQSYLEFRGYKRRRINGGSSYNVRAVEYTSREGEVSKINVDVFIQERIKEGLEKEKEKLQRAAELKKVKTKNRVKDVIKAAEPAKVLTTEEQKEMLNKLNEDLSSICYQ